MKITLYFKVCAAATVVSSNLACAARKHAVTAAAPLEYDGGERWGKGSEGMATIHVSSGVFFAPETGNEIFLRLSVNGYTRARAGVLYRVERIDEQGERSRIREGTLDVPSGGGASVDVPDVAGSNVEVSLRLPSRGLKPTLELIQRFRADGATTSELHLAPPQFLQQVLPAGLM